MAVSVYFEGAYETGLHKDRLIGVMEAVIHDPSVKAYYNEKNDTDRNSGFDLYLPGETVFPAGATVMVNFGVSMKTKSGSGYWLLPRSSLSKTPLRLANSVGLVDPEYRGCLIGALHNTGTTDVTIPAGTRLLQVALPSLFPFRVEWVSSLDETERGSGGFGSTGGTAVNFIR